MAAVTGPAALLERSLFHAPNPARASSTASAVSFRSAHRNSSFPIATPKVTSVTGSGIGSM